MAVTLKVLEYKSPYRWLWRLEDEKGNCLESHPVDLSDDNTDTSGYRGYDDLSEYLGHHAGTETDAVLLARVGRWMGEHVLGGMRPKLRALLEQAGGMLPVRIVAPPEAQHLICHPLELAWLDEGKPLAEAGVRLIWEYTNGAGGTVAKDTGGPLRVLGVFSLPTDRSALNLRKERVAFKRLLDTLAASKGLAIETRVLQYGTTREALRGILREAPGWDIIHFSCHGTQGALILERDNGEADAVPAEKLGALLQTSRPRLKLVILSACWSGAGLTHAQARRLLRLDPKPAGQPQPAGHEALESLAGTRLFPSLAQELAESLDCATLAMRYPVGDDFAIGLAKGLFHELLHDRQPLPEALQIALGDALRKAAPGSAPALSPITPMLVGPRAAALRFAPPKVTPDFDLEKTGLLGFPEAPEHFVGRAGPMLHASKALATESRQSGILFHGMAGGGKTACALELAHLYEHGRFQGFVWFKCPDEGQDIQTALLNCLEAMANQLHREPAEYIGNVDDPIRFRERTVPALKQFFRKNAILVVIDNMESLLTPENNWLDDKWGDFVGALLEHGGPSRTVLTSRRVPKALLGRPGGLLIENVTALSLSESLLLARELPNLRALYDDERNGRPLLCHALEVLQGHPKLLEFADKLAANRVRFADMVQKARDAAERDGAPLKTFLEAGESEQDVEAFRKALDNWTGTLVGTLPPTARLLFAFLCRLEDEDRWLNVIETVWPHFLKRLGDQHPEAKAALAQPNGGLEAALKAVVASGLAGQEVRKVETIQVDKETKQPRLAVRELAVFTIHPGVAEAGRETVGQAVRDAVDWELGDFYGAHYARGMETEMEGGGGLIVAAARRATPYLMRVARWEEAATLIMGIIHRDSSPAAVLWAIPLLRRIAEKTKGTERENIDVGVLATALTFAGRYDEAEDLLRDVIARCESSGDWRAASVGAGQLVNVLLRLARLTEALEWAAKRVAFSRKAGLGPWSQLVGEGQRLQVLNAMGRWSEVLDAVEVKRAEMARLPEERGANEVVDPWNVRETLLNTGGQAALELDACDTALALNGEIVESKRRRGADAHDVAQTQFNDYSPLLRLKRFPEARGLLDHCRQVFDEERDYAALGAVYSALADLEDKEGRPAAAAPFEETALKYKYQSGEPEDCSISHNNLSNYLERAGKPREGWLPHCLADALLCLQIGSGGIRTSLRNLALSELPTSPPSFDDVADAVEQLDGVRFRALFARLPKTYPDGDAALAALWHEVEKEKARMANEEKETQTVLASLPPAVRAAIESGDVEKLKEALAALPEAEPKNILRRLREAGIIGDAQGPDMAEVMREFEPLLTAIAGVAVGAASGEVRRTVEAHLEQLETNGWRLRDAAQHIWAGERDAAALTAGVDANDAQLIRRVLDLIAQYSSQ